MSESPRTPREDLRDPECVKAWPECRDGDYNPACCRFPKSCSCGGLNVGGYWRASDREPSPLPAEMVRAAAKEGLCSMVDADAMLKAAGVPALLARIEAVQNLGQRALEERDEARARIEELEAALARAIDWAEGVDHQIYNERHAGRYIESPEITELRRVLGDR